MTYFDHGNKSEPGTCHALLSECEWCQPRTCAEHLEALILCLEVKKKRLFIILLHYSIMKFIKGECAEKVFHKDHIIVLCEAKVNILLCLHKSSSTRFTILFFHTAWFSLLRKAVLWGSHHELLNLTSVVRRRSLPSLWGNRLYLS